MVTDCKILSDLPEYTSDHLPVQYELNIEVTNSNNNLKRVSARSIPFPRIDWNKPEMCDIHSGLLRQQALSLPIVRTEDVMNKGEAVCVVNSMCDQVTECIHSVCEAIQPDKNRSTVGGRKRHYWNNDCRECRDMQRFW